MTRRIGSPLEIVRGAWGAVLLAAPRYALRVVAADSEPDAWAINVTRILGARHLVQAIMTGWSTSTEELSIGVWVDGAHAVTALALARLDHKRARLGLTDAAVAAVWGGAGRHRLRTRRRRGGETA